VGLCPRPRSGVPVRPAHWWLVAERQPQNGVPVRPAHWRKPAAPPHGFRKNIAGVPVRPAHAWGSAPHPDPVSAGPSGTCVGLRPTPRSGKCRSVRHMRGAPPHTPIRYAGPSGVSAGGNQCSQFPPRNPPPPSFFPFRMTQGDRWKSRRAVRRRPNGASPPAPPEQSRVCRRSAQAGKTREKEQDSP